VKRCVCNCRNTLREEFPLPSSTSSERKCYIVGYLFNAGCNVRPGWYPLATTKSMISFWQIRCLQDQNIKVVQLTANILHGNQLILNQVRDGEYSMVFVSPLVLLRDSLFFWKVIIRGKKWAFSKRLCAVLMDECHLVWHWRELRKDYLSLGAIHVHFKHLPFVVLSAMIIPKVSNFIINSVGLRPVLRLYKAAIDRENITPMVAQIDPAQGYAHLSVLVPITGAA